VLLVASSSACANSSTFRHALVRDRVEDDSISSLRPHALLHQRLPTPLSDGRSAVADVLWFRSGCRKLLTHSREPLCVVEPGGHGAYDVLTRRDSVREHALQESVAVDPLAARDVPPSGQCRRRRPRARTTRRSRRRGTAPARLRRARRLTRNSMRAAPMRAQRRRTTEGPSALGTNERGRDRSRCGSARRRPFAARPLTARSFAARSFAARSLGGRRLSLR
jgi:hypothetical protein